MIRLIIEINEEDKIELNDILAVGTNISIKEIGINPTNVEKKVSNLLKDRINVNEKIQVENYSGKEKSEIKSKLEKILKSI